MAEAQETAAVKVHYTARLSDGTEVATTRDGSPLQFTVGKNEVIEGLEEAVADMQVGESKRAEIAAEKAFGRRRPELTAKIDQGQLPDNIQPEVGRRLELQMDDGQTIPVVITEVAEKTITLDGNHPLAGRDLLLDVEMVERS